MRDNCNKIECPRCGRVHSVLNKKRELRKTIHCRCKDEFKYHTEIFWLDGVGYVIYGENGNLVDAFEPR